VLSQVPARGIYLVKRTGRLAIVFLAPVVFNVGLNLVLIPHYGMMGAAWSTLLAYPVMFGLTLWLAQHVYPIPYDYRRIAKPLLLAFGLSLLKDAVPAESVLLALAFKALILATFPLLLLVWGFVTREERRAILRVLYRPVLPPVPSPAGK
jgi:O-antigen/teichoic acid export membrane protein